MTLTIILAYAKLDFMDINDIRQHSDNAASWLKTISHKDRLVILCQLTHGEMCVGDLSENSDLSQSAFSQQLAVLRKHKLVKTRKESQTVYYSLADNNVINLIQLLSSIFCK